MLLLGAHLRELRISMWLDGLIGGLGAATLAAAVLLPPIVDDAHGDVGSVAVALAYPIGDLLLLIFTIAALGMTGWRPGRVWLLIAASMLLTAIADSTYLYQTATHSYRADTWLEGPVARRRDPAGDRRVDAVAAHGAPADRGLAAGVGARRVAAGGAGGAASRQLPPSSLLLWR